VVRNVTMISVLILLSGLTFPKAVGAQETSHLIMRGPHGAFQVVEPESAPDLPFVKAASLDVTQLSRSAPIFVTRGPHGASYLVTETGMGGPEGSGVYPGFPDLTMRGSHGAFSLK
jgi:hypothetical protein